jgi:hypothetical protein
MRIILNTSKVEEKRRALFKPTFSKRKLGVNGSSLFPLIPVDPAGAREEEISLLKISDTGKHNAFSSS